MNNGADGAPPNHHRPRSVGRRFAGPASRLALRSYPHLTSMPQANSRYVDEQRKVMADMGTLRQP